MTGGIDTGSTSQTLIGKLDIGDPLYLHPSDSSALTIVNIKLKGTENYSVWSSPMKLALEAKNKYGFIDGKRVRSESDSVLASQWDRCNSVVLTWLLNSISEELFLGQVSSKLASEVWTDLKESFYRVDGSIKQFDAMLHLPTCSCQAAKDFNDFSTLIKLMQFLMGLDDVYQSVRTNLLTREPLPSVKVAFSVVSREESHRMSSTGSKTQNVAFVSRPNQSFDQKKRFNKGSNSNLKCTHCNMLGHTVDRCFEIIGYPSGFKKRSNNNNQSGKSNVASGNKSNAVNNVSSSVGSSGFPFTSEQIAKLLSLVGEKSVSDSQNPNVGGASQHMVKTDKDLINSVDVSEFNITVSHPNGTNVKVLKIGDLKLTNELILKDVFYVPGYSDSSSKKILMSGSQNCGLYFVGNSGNLFNACFNSSVQSFTWHSRLGHPSDQVLAVLKQSLKIHSSEHGPCDICHRAKQVRVPFPLSEHKSRAVGDLIHLDVWGPYRVFYELVLTQFKKKVKIIRSDNGTEFVNSQMNSFFKTKVSNIPDDEEGTNGAQDPISDDQQPLSPSTSAPVSGAEMTLQTEQEGSSGQDANERAEDTIGSNVETNQSEGNTSVRKSSRNTVLPRKFGDFVVEGKVKYGVEKVVNYANLS
ncbi:uncharacterized protein LOC110914084 [Helianthus annuus]|uniref:uncharacterized protein LOC110914084 n=1 Tax=Helianthus annuus TaxID=4232 RepID=UPI000B8FFDBA|nr:uncharacterized protein LOC110914084 [Helianthus annuus]